MNEKTVTFYRKKAASLGKDISEITNVNHLRSDEYSLRQISENTQNETEKNYHKIPFEFMEILTDEFFPDVFEPYLRKLRYVLCRNRFPFKDIGVPVPLNDIDKRTYEQAYQINDLKNKMAERIKPHSGKQYFNNFAYENYPDFIKDYLTLSITPFFSFADIWELKIRYLNLLDKHIKKEFRAEADYAFY